MYDSVILSHTDITNDIMTVFVHAVEINKT